MKMHHLDKEKVEAVMQKVKEVVNSGQYPPELCGRSHYACGMGTGR